MRVRPFLGAVGLFVLVWVALTGDGVPDPGGYLARRALVPPRAGRRARGARRPRSAPSEREARPRSLVAHRLLVGLSAAISLARPAPRRPADLRRRRAACDAQHRRRHRLRGRASVRRARHGVRLLRRADASRARAPRRPGRAACRDPGRPAREHLTTFATGCCRSLSESPERASLRARLGATRGGSSGCFG